MEVAFYESDSDQVGRPVPHADFIAGILREMGATSVPMRVGRLRLAFWEEGPGPPRAGFVYTVDGRRYFTPLVGSCEAEWKLGFFHAVENIYKVIYENNPTRSHDPDDDR